MIKRELVKTILKGVKPGFVNLIYGPRRVGKTVLLSQIQSEMKEKALTFNGDTQETRDLLSTTSETRISQIVGKSRVIFIDEAQRIKNIMLFLKILIDKFPTKKVFVTGSSSLRLASGARETLTGRTKIYKLYPLSFSEQTEGINRINQTYVIPDILVYGGYPYLSSLTSPEEKQHYLKNITEDYLFRDVLLSERLVSQDVIFHLTTLLAFQIGQEVSLNELSNKLRIDIATVSRYLHLLMESFVILVLPAYSSNLRREVTRSKKYYFYDLGIRNAITGQFTNVDLRNDTGFLWENFLILERMKRNQKLGLPTDCFFWRNYAQAEIDYIEKTNSDISAYEFKWQHKAVHTPKAFFEAYGQKTKTVSKDDFLDFIS